MPSLPGQERYTMKYILAGDNDYALKKRLHELTDSYIRTHGDLAFERLDAEEVTDKQLQDAINSVPFLASQKMVVLSIVTNKDMLETIAEVDVPDSTILIAVITKLDKRASYYKKMTKQDGFELFEKSEPKNLPAWIIQTVKEQGGSISRPDAMKLLDRIGPDQMLLVSEISKLITYNREITSETIELLTELTPQSTVFQLLDAAFGGNMQRVEELYKQQRTQKVEPLAIIGMLAWQLHILALIKTAGERSANQIAKDAKLNPYTVSKSQPVAKKLSLHKIKQLVSELHQLDIDLKSKRIDSDQAVLNYLFRLTQ